MAGPLSKHQKYFLQSLGFLKKPSSSHSNGVPGSGVVGGSGVVIAFGTVGAGVVVVVVVVAIVVVVVVVLGD